MQLWVRSALAPPLVPLVSWIAWLCARALLMSGEVVRLAPWLAVRVASTRVPCED